MCDDIILENDETLMFKPNCCKDQKLCNKVVDNYNYAL